MLIGLALTLAKIVAPEAVEFLGIRRYLGVVLDDVGCYADLGVLWQHCVI